MNHLDNHIIKRCLKGDRKAQMQLYTAFYKRVYNSCFRLLRDKQDAEDAMQESFIKVFSGLDKYGSVIPFEAWIVRIAINTCIDKLRENKMEFVDCENRFLSGIEEENEEEDWEQISGKVEQVKTAIALLPDSSRIIISLYLIEGYDHEEIGGILNIQPGASRIQYMRAKQKLVELLKKEIK
jgi:RNA polymerase sigma-70 factor (ECF subfamily)